MPHLLIVEGLHSGKKISLERPEFCIGRASKGNHLVLHDENVSRRHLRFVIEGDAVYVEDLGSTSGTYVNGESIRRQPLSDGDDVLVGKTTFRFGCQISPTPTPERPLAEVVLPGAERPSSRHSRGRLTTSEGGRTSNTPTRSYLREDITQRSGIEQLVIHAAAIGAAGLLGFVVYWLQTLVMGGD